MIIRLLLFFILFLLSPKHSSAQNWQEVGPVGKINCANGPSIFIDCPTGVDANGAVNFVEFHPHNPDILYCSTFGGIFKSTNNGHDWTSLRLDQYAKNTTVVNTIELDNKDPDYIYLATGYMLEMNKEVAANFNIQANPFTEGIFRSSDGGKSWSAINKGLPNIYQTKFSFSGREHLAGYYINDLMLSPFDSNILLAATSEGIYITNNSKDSIPVWKRLSALPADNFRCIRFVPGSDRNNYTLFVSGNSGIYKSTDMTTWTSVIGAGTGLDKEIIARGCFPPNAPAITDFYIDASMVHPGWIYAIVTSKLSTKDNLKPIHEDRKIFRYNGTNWSLLKNIDNCAKETYNSSIAVDPVTDEIYYTDIRLSKINSQTLSIETVPGYWTRSESKDIHADMRQLRFHPNKSIRKLYCPNDGMLSIFDLTCSKITPQCWLPVQNNGLRACRALGFDGSATNPDHYLLGTWDTGSLRFIDGKWINYDIGDGMDPLILKDNLFIEATYQLRRFDMENNKVISLPQPDPGNDWLTKSFYKDPFDPSVFYHCGYHVYKYTDWGNNAPVSISYAAAYAGSGPESISSFAVNPLDNTTMYMALRKTDDFNYHEKTDSSNKIIWLLKTTNPAEGWQNASNNLPFRDDNISGMVVSRNNSDVVYIAYAGRNVGRGKIFRYNTGQSNSQQIEDGYWTDYNNSATSIPWYYRIFNIAAEPGRHDALYAATDGGVYYTNKTMKNWILFDNDVLPPTAAVDIYVNDTYVSVATFGNGVWRSTLACINDTAHSKLSGIFKKQRTDSVRPCYPANSFKMPSLEVGNAPMKDSSILSDKLQKEEITEVIVSPLSKDGNFKLTILDTLIVNGELIISNAKGQKVYSTLFRKEQPILEIRLKDPEPGTYMLQIHSNRKSISKKIILRPGTGWEEEEEEHGRTADFEERKKINRAAKKSYKKFCRENSK